MVGVRFKVAIRLDVCLIKVRRSGAEDGLEKTQSAEGKSDAAKIKETRPHSGLEQKSNESNESKKRKR